MNQIERAIREFGGPSNSGIRRKLRAIVADGRSVLVLRGTVALTGIGEAKLRAIAEAQASSRSDLTVREVDAASV